MKVLHQIRPELAAMVTAQLADVEMVAVASDREPDAAVRAEVLLTYPWGAPNLPQVLARGVRWVHLLGTGVDAFPLDLLTDQILTCSRAGSAVPIAEWVLAVMLAFEKNLPGAWISQPPAKPWGRAALGGLHGKTLGLVGWGGIAHAVAERALPFGMNVHAFRRSPEPSDNPQVSIVGSLTDLAAAADHIVVAAASTASTRHIIDAGAFAAMKPGVHLINVARGALIDQDALRAALENGVVAMASLDTVEPEPLPAAHWLYSHPRVRLSPHISWSMPSAAERLLAPFIDNLRRYRDGRPLLGRVDIAAGY